MKLVLLLLVLIGLGLAFASDQDILSQIQLGLQLLRAAGPVTFFLAMALLPAAGAPLSFFCLTAGPVFGPQLGMTAVLFWSLLAIAVNISVSFLLARRVLRPPLSSLLGRLGYQLPQVQAAGSNELIVLLRVTPGVPFAVQNYLLGLSGVGFGRYLLVSCAIAFPLNAGIIYFGEALLQGQAGATLVGLLAVLAALAAIQLVRRHFRRATAVPTQDPRA